MGGYLTRVTPHLYSLICNAVNQQGYSDNLAEILRRYHDEQIIFQSSAQKHRYAIAARDDKGVSVERLDAHEAQRVTYSQAEKILLRIQSAGRLDFTSLDDTAAVRNTVLQAETVALSADQKDILYLPDNGSRLKNFLEVLDNLRMVDPLYKPAMLLCFVEGVETGELLANEIAFDWIAPRFIAKLKLLGKEVTEQQAAQPFYHLTGDLFWLHAVPNFANLMQDGSEGPTAARTKIKFALLKDTYWNLLKDSFSRTTIRRKLEELLMPTTSAQQILSGLEAAVRAVGFVYSGELVRRFICALAAKPFVILTGNSGTGKTKLAELFAHWFCGEENTRFALVPVGADWTDNRNVLGFVNHLRSDKVNESRTEVEVPIYQSTKILDLLLEAARKENERKPFFLILDEMNLSHVERYFADFLSTMESNDGGLLLHREGRPLPRRPNGPHDVPETLALPRNVFVIGTVNVDETTYMFSPKVLDRANVLEFRVEQGAPLTFLKSGGQSVGAIGCAPVGYGESFLELALRAKGARSPALALVVDPGNRPFEAEEGMENCRTTIADLFSLMQKRHQEFAFRSMAEILRFLTVDYELTPKIEEWNGQSAIDSQILQKILPKLHGSKRKIGSLLAALAKYCERGNRADAEALLSNETKAEDYLAMDSGREKSPQFPQSYLKLCEMMEAVRRDQFVSFIQ